MQKRKLILHEAPVFFQIMRHRKNFETNSAMKIEQHENFPVLMNLRSLIIGFCDGLNWVLNLVFYVGAHFFEISDLW